MTDVDVLVWLAATLAGTAVGTWAGLRHWTAPRWLPRRRQPPTQFYRPFAPWPDTGDPDQRISEWRP